MRIWDRYLTDTDRAVFEAAGFGADLGLGARPALVVIDVTYAFTGYHDEPVVASVKRWRQSCGERAWAAIPHIAALREAFHELGLPVFYTRGFDARDDGKGNGLWRSSRNDEVAPVDFDREEIVEQVAPGPADVVLRKIGPSAFFGTPLFTHLNLVKADTVVLCGGTTSGCVRATAVDAFSAGFRVGVAEDACFDRGEVSHAISLFDLNAKYADVWPTDTLLGDLRSTVAAST